MKMERTRSASSGMKRREESVSTIACAVRVESRRGAAFEFIMHLPGDDWCGRCKSCLCPHTSSCEKWGGKRVRKLGIKICWGRDEGSGFSGGEIRPSLSAKVCWQ